MNISPEIVAALTSALGGGALVKFADHWLRQRGHNRVEMAEEQRKFEELNVTESQTIRQELRADLRELKEAQALLTVKFDEKKEQYIVLLAENGALKRQVAELMHEIEGLRHEIVMLQGQVELLQRRA